MDRFVTIDEACQELGCRPAWIQHLLTGEPKPLVTTRQGADGATLVSLKDLDAVDKSELEITTNLAADRYGCIRQNIDQFVRGEKLPARKPGRDMLVKVRDVVELKKASLARGHREEEGQPAEAG